MLGVGPDVGRPQDMLGRLPPFLAGLADLVQEPRSTTEGGLSRQAHESSLGRCSGTSMAPCRLAKSWAISLVR
jgi:hypothetical protein